MKILVVVPAFNEVHSIGEVIKDLKHYEIKNIVVVDDGSVDGTLQQAKKNGAQILRHVVNRGLGAALGTGFAHARQKDIDILVTFDADGQHEAKEIKNLVAPIISGESDVVIGSRLLGRKDMPLDRRILNFLSNVLTFFLFGVWTTDSQSGFRAFNRRAINCISIKTDRMEVSSEFFKEIRDNRLRFLEIPIKAIYTAYGIVSTKQENWAPVKISARLFLRLFR